MIVRMPVDATDDGGGMGGGHRVVSGKQLISALGFANARAFQRARKAGRIAVPLYPIPGQSRGLFAYARDLVPLEGKEADKKGGKTRTM